MGRKKVYVAGPYTKGDSCINTHNAIVAGNQLWDAGYTPFIPHLCHLWHCVTPRPYALWLEYDFEFLSACDILLRLPGESNGADAEVAEANRLGIPVFYGIDALLGGPA